MAEPVTTRADAFVAGGARRNRARAGRLLGSVVRYAVLLLVAAVLVQAARD